MASNSRLTKIIKLAIDELDTKNSKDMLRMADIKKLGRFVDKLDAQAQKVIKSKNLKMSQDQIDKEIAVMVALEIATRGARYLRESVRLNENPDAVVVGHGEYTTDKDIENATPGTGKKVASFRDGDSVAFGWYRGEVFFSDFKKTHTDIQVNFDGGYPYISREKFKYPGRLWWNKKIISFWDYPPHSQLKKIIAQLNDGLAKTRHLKRIKIDGNWKMDIPRSSEMVDMEGGSKASDIFRGPLDWSDKHSDYVWKNTRLYSIKNVLGNKPLKGLGKPWKERGSSINTDKGQQHVAGAMAKGKAVAKMDDRQKKELWNYYKNKASLSPDEKRMLQMVQRSLKREDVEIYYTNRSIIAEGFGKKIIVESPDMIVVNQSYTSQSGVEHKVPTKLFGYKDGGFAFGYFNGKMVIGDEKMWHSDTIARDRHNMKYPGRIWPKKKVVSFWVYPNLSQLKKVLKDIEDTWNNVPLTDRGDREFSTGKDIFGNDLKRPSPRAKHYGKISIGNDWRLDIPAETGDTYKDFVRGTGGADVAPRDYDTYGYLYSLRTVFSGKPLKGAGEKLRAGKKVSTQDVDHLKSAMSKGNAVAKMSPQQKKSLYNYFKAKGRLDPAERRMWQVLNKEGINIFFDRKNKKFIFEAKRYFTLEEGSGILTEAPHIQVGDKAVDFEFEKDKVEGLKKIIKAILKQEISDKYGSKFKLSSQSEVDEFINKIMRNPQIKRSIS